MIDRNTRIKWTIEQWFWETLQGALYWPLEEKLRDTCGYREFLKEVEESLVFNDNEKVVWENRVTARGPSIKTLAECARIMGRSNERARQIEKRVIEKLTLFIKKTKFYKNTEHDIEQFVKNLHVR